ncbi:MAG TPA: MSMEG_4193 family putative phosphomutase [Verrucomicrobiae bacterium]|nr:MSMEG_4193 family putative phosphomutase [Verrucomicrobiae bacterium]
MTTVLLLRHGLTALTGPILSGWTPGLHLDERGRAQVASLGERIRAVPLAAIVSSPLERCRETAEAVIAGRQPAPPLHVDERLGEVHYGSWTGRPFTELTKDPLWRVVQAHPSAAVFPDGEGLAAMAARAAEAVRDWNERLGPDAMYALVSHADVIKSLIADALGLHLDGYQRIMVDPASLSVIQYTPLRTFVVRVNDSVGGVEALVPKPPSRRRRAR